MGATAAAGEAGDGELEPTANGREGALLSQLRRPAQRMVELGHGPARVGFPLRQLQQLALAIGWQGQLVQVATADADGVGL
jgi:hypothetical protein